MNKYLQIAGAAAVAGCCGYFLGVSVSSPRGGDAKSSVVQSVAKYEGPAAPPPAAGAGKNAAASASLVVVSNAADACRQITEILRERPSLERLRRITDLLALMSPENANVYLDGFFKYLEGSVIGQYEGALFNRRFGEIIGPVIVGQRTGTQRDKTGTRTYVRDQFLGWLSTDPVAARAWLDGLKDEQFREAMIPTYLESVVSKDVNAAVSILKSLPEDVVGQNAAGMIRTLRETKSATETSQWVADLAAQSAGGDPPVWLRELTDAMMQPLTVTREVGPEVAEAFAMHYGRSYLSPHWGDTIAKRYASNDPQQALLWAAGLETGSQNASGSLVGNAIEGIKPEKLEATAAWAATIVDTRIRDAIVSAMEGRKKVEG